jgi:hypothetical protein
VRRISLGGLVGAAPATSPGIWPSSAAKHVTSTTPQAAEAVTRSSFHVGRSLSSNQPSATTRTGSAAQSRLEALALVRHVGGQLRNQWQWSPCTGWTAIESLVEALAMPCPLEKIKRPADYSAIWWLCVRSTCCAITLGRFRHAAKPVATYSYWISDFTEITLMDVTEGCEAPNCLWHSTSRDYEIEVDDWPDGEPRNRGAPDMLNAENRPGSLWLKLDCADVTQRTTVRMLRIYSRIADLIAAGAETPWLPTGIDQRAINEERIMRVARPSVVR